MKKSAKYLALFSSVIILTSTSFAQEDLTDSISLPETSEEEVEAGLEEGEEEGADSSVLYDDKDLDEVYFVDKKPEKIPLLKIEEAKPQAKFTGFANDGFYYEDSQKLVNAERVIDGVGYKFDAKGTKSKAKNERLSDGRGGLWYVDNNSKILRGFQEFSNNRYVFNYKTGKLTRSAPTVSQGIRYYCDEDGVARRIGRDYYKGKLSYVTEKGNLTKGLKKIGDTHYFFDEDGDMVTDSNRKVGNQWWYFDFYGRGAKTNGKFKVGRYGDYYYFPDGKRVRGYHQIGGNFHYFDDIRFNMRRNFYGAMDFRTYYFDSYGNGRYLSNLYKNPSKAGTLGQFSPGPSNYLGRKTPYYSQRDPRRAYRSFARTGSNFATMACGSTAMAMALSRELNNPNIYPTTIANDAYYYTNWEGTEWEFFADEARRYGLNAYGVPIKEVALIQAVKDHPVVLRAGPGYFTNSGHFLVLDSYKSGRFYLNDPYNLWNSQRSYTFSDIVNNVTTAWQIK